MCTWILPIGQKLKKKYRGAAMQKRVLTRFVPSVHIDYYRSITFDNVKTVEIAFIFMIDDHMTVLYHFFNPKMSVKFSKITIKELKKQLS